jgi:FAD/FMN-containing dehydrogenase
VELGAVPEHGVHDDGEPPCEGDTRLAACNSTPQATAFTALPNSTWAVRGGGGNFGVVTTFKFRMHSLGRAILKRWVYPTTDAAGILRRYREMLYNAPRELTTMFILMRDELRLSALWSGSTHGAAAALDQFGRVGQGTPVIDGEVGFLDLQRSSDERLAWGRRYYTKGGFLREIDEQAIAVMSESIAAVGVPEAEIYCLQLGGAVSEIDESATPYSGRASGHYWIAQCVWDSPAEDLPAISWGRRTANRLAAISLKANYVNEHSDTGIAESAYGEAKYKRLAHLKWQYDPTNLFRLNQNIEPRQR